ncbi:site-specific integrase [Rhodopseudomonas boonkerdii]|uniref:site-specific integrase n=1 Tax=Rhodopseudomonas boonkerdii TaxID=475937 RepID=UPI001E5F4EDC|nr:site-specific integrase [Rhodopseudomonas boonkerdii]UGV24847.1 site-specific integrase [Rhodopseudomonas boonkerdii]
MPLAMSRPWKHPKTGIYWLRKRVPDELITLVGKREELRTLGTKDPAQAKVRHAAALAEIEAKWANLRSGQKSLTEREAHHLAAPFYDRWLQRHLENPSQQTDWRVDLGSKIFQPSQAPANYDFLYVHSTEMVVDRDELRVREMERWCLEWADSCASNTGLRLVGDDNRLLARAIGAAVQRASVVLQQLAQGVTMALPIAAISSSIVAPSPSREPYAFGDLVDGWAKERRPVAKTLYEWSRVVKQLVAFLKHDNARALLGDDLVRWKEAMLNEGLRPKTIQDAKLAPVRAILQWGVVNKKISSNVADGISLDTRSKQSEKKRSFTDEEAKIVLTAAMASSDPVKRWVPWIGAYSGARVSEICQLRREDVVEIDGIWCMKIMPEAGSVKTAGSERIIPVHPALEKSGFLKFALQKKAGPIFPELPPDKFGRRGGNGTKVIGRFVRQLGITDPRISPSHSWRHRMKTLGRRYGLAKDILEAMTGHGSKSVADAYGEFPVEALYRELCKVPQLNVGVAK